jgi:hypothetical protein
MKRVSQPSLLLALAVFLLFPASGAAAFEVNQAELGPYYSPMQRMCVERANPTLNNMIEPQKYDQVCQCATQQLTAVVRKMSADELAQAQQPDMKRRTDGKALQVLAACFAPVLSDVMATKVLDRCQARVAQATLSGHYVKGGDAFCNCMSASLKRNYATEDVLSNVFSMAMEPSPDVAKIKEYVVNSADVVAKKAQQECTPLVQP